MRWRDYQNEEVTNKRLHIENSLNYLDVEILGKLR